MFEGLAWNYWPLPKCAPKSNFSVNRFVDGVECPTSDSEADRSGRVQNLVDFEEDIGGKGWKRGRFSI